jgi:hypothetical protein
MLINAAEQLNKLLRDLGVAKLFNFVSGDETVKYNGEKTEVQLSGKASLLTTAQTVVDAHKTLVEADSLSDTVRGAGGFGSTAVR